MNNYIDISNVFYSYNEVNALKDINLRIGENELFGVIGPDGAGKTTLFRLLATLLVPKKGYIHYNNVDIVENFKRIRKEIGYMPGKFSLYEDLSIEENLSFFASVFKTTINDNFYLIEDIYKMLEPFKKRRAGKLSGGMKQKLALCCALIHKPKVLLLDEPTTGVDAVSRREFWDMLYKLKSMGITIVVSTPYMDEAKRCDRVALIKDGEILKTESPEVIENQFSNQLYAFQHQNNYKMLKLLNAIDVIENAYAFGQNVHVVLQNEKNVKLIERILVDKGLNEVKIEKAKPTIEDCFIQQMIEKNAV